MTERYRALLVIKNGDRLTVFLKLPDENHSDFAQEGFALYAVISKKERSRQLSHHLSRRLPWRFGGKRSPDASADFVERVTSAGTC